MPDIKSQTLEELQAQFQAWNQPAYRVSQLLEWLFVHRVADWDAMANLPKAQPASFSELGLSFLQRILQPLLGIAFVVLFLDSKGER